jgi:hypothetical protein
MTSTLQPPRWQAERELTADRLLVASARHSFDPQVDLDWTADFEPDAYFMPEHRVSLYGTDLWAGLDRKRRIALSRHEVASMCSVGIWFELILLHMLARHLYDLDPTTRHAQYALTEIADECRHSVMFGQLIEKLGCPNYGAGRHAHALGRLFKATCTGPEIFAGALVAEEILDSFQREAMADPNVQPFVREVSRIHVVEEARHVRYAREELLRQLAELARAKREPVRFVVARTAQIVAGRLVNPAVYTAVGLDQQLARQVARGNPHRRESLRWAASRLVEFFTEAGLIGGPSRLLWERAGLVG